MKQEYKDIENIELYLEGKLEGEELVAFEKAMAGVSDTDVRLSVSMENYQAAVNLVKAYNRKLLKNRLRQIHKDVAKETATVKKLRRWYWAAAMVVGLLCVGLTIVYLTGDEFGKQAEDNIVKLEHHVNELEKETLTSFNDTVEEGYEEEKPEQEASGTIMDFEDKKLIAANFKKNPKYESLIATIYRGADISVLSPDTLAVYAPCDTIVFSWEGEVDEELIIKIIDNHERAVYEARIVGAQEYIFSKVLDTGLYYWMLETEEDNLGYGRFLVR